MAGVDEAAVQAFQESGESLAGGLHPDYLRSLMFGVEDGLVSTTGAVVGIAVGSRDPDVIVLAGVVLVAVEALSMAAGQFLSERAVHQMEPSHRDKPLVGGALMFFAYLAAGLVPLLPVVVVRTTGAVWVGAALALLALFGLGFMKGRLVGVPRVRSGLEILVVGGLAAAVGVMVGVLFETGR